MQIQSSMVSKVLIQDLNGEAFRSVRNTIKELCGCQPDLSERRTGKYSGGKEGRKLEGNVKIDQIHLVLSFAPRYSIAEVAGLLKGKSDIKIFDTYLISKNR